MSTPLYRKMKNGSSFYTFPSSSMHTNPNFTKFVLLNIPNSIDNIGNKPGRLDFQEDNFQANTYGIYADHSSHSTYSDRLVESLRNYVANHDEIMRNSRISTTKDFYNIKEKQTPTEIIFWKWLKKMKAIEFEVARHKVDWNKNLPDFDNNNADTITNTDYFRKYLWKEREVIEYTIETIQGIGLSEYYTISYNNVVEIIISYKATFKVGDDVLFNNTYETIETGKKYTIIEKIYDIDKNQTFIYINVDGFSEEINPNGTPNLTVKLYYNRLVQYIGEINMKSDVKTSRKDETEIMAYIPHQAGKTPTVLFTSRFDSNYYPGLELPILPAQIQTEILGAENLDSPIRKNPSDYPGSYYGQFDNSNKTYESSTGDKFRYSGEYFGVSRNNNIGLSDENYIETLEEFDSTYLDGINLNFNLNHYLKMSITDKQVGFNFDVFNQLTIDNIPPQSFEYNAILWYYEIEGDNINDKNVYTNLYGITFLNNPDNSTTYVYNSDTGNQLDYTQIDTYKKLVSNDEYDGLSYIHTLNIMTSVDNDISSMSFDPLTINNNYGFEIYQNVMTNVAKLNESYLNIINSFLTMNTELNTVKSLVYTQTDIDTLKSKMLNMEELLKLYAKYQFIDSDTVSITTNYANTYPTLAFNVKNTEYSNIYNLKTTDIFNYYISNGTGYKITVPDSNKLFIKITNDDITDYGDLSIILDKDLKFKQSVEVYIDCNSGYYNRKLNFLINYYDSTVGYPQNTTLESLNVYFPNDIGNNLTNSPIYNKVHYNSNTISQNINLIEAVGTTSLPYTLFYTSNQNLFGSSDYEEKVYIDNFYLKDTSEQVTNKSGIYTIGKTSVDFNQAYFKISELDTFNLTVVGTPVVYLVKALKIIITRIDSSDTSSITDRYLIQKIYI